MNFERERLHIFSCIVRSIAEPNLGVTLRSLGSRVFCNFSQISSQISS